ncbi:hypothetical protein ACLIA0_14925 [Bacillaceae bacterium W0354]
MEDVTFFTLLPESIKGKRMEADKEFLMYLTIALSFADKHDLILRSACGISTYENSRLREYFSKLRKGSTVLIVSPKHVANDKILNQFIRKDVRFRVIDEDYIIKPELLKKQWLGQETIVVSEPLAGN